MSFHRTRSSQPLSCSAMSTLWIGKEQLLLYSGGLKNQSDAPEPHRRNSYQMALLWLETDLCNVKQRRTQGELKTSQAPFANYGFASHCSLSKYIKKHPRTSKVSIFAQRSPYSKASPGFQLRYHLYSASKGVCLSCCCYRLVHSNDFVVETFKQSRWILLHRSFRRGLRVGNTRNFQHGSRSTVYLKELCFCSSLEGSSAQHGWKRESSRQRLRRAILEVS